MRAAKVLGVTVAAAALAACSGSSAPTATPAPPASAAATDTNPRLAARAVHYLHVNFKGTSWLGDVKQVRVRDGDMFVVTDLYPDSDADGPARSLCTALRLWPPAPRDVHVVSTTGKWIGC